MSFMTPEERVKALEELEARQQRSQKRAAWSAWISVAVAAIVLAGLIALANSQLGELRQETASLTRQKEDLKKGMEDLKTQKESLERQKAVVVGALSQVPEAQRQEAVAKQLAASPQSAALLPRIYMQTVSIDDNARAQYVRKQLENAGYVVLGIENVPKALPLQKKSDVRFYHAAEQKEAEKIAAVMKQAGETDVGVLYLKQYENSTATRPNHFEVWLAHGTSDQMLLR